MSFLIYLVVLRFNFLEIIPLSEISAMEHVREGFVLVDNENNYLFSNPAAAKILPGIKKLIKGESVFSIGNWPKELKSENSDLVEFSVGEKNPKHFKASFNPVFSQSQTLIARIILFSDITDSVLLQKKLENAAYIDALTGLYNRKHFFELAGISVERAQRLDQSIFTAMIDLDFFKKVNDTYGHAAGDMVLVNTAAIARQTIRSYDLLGRYGGEEFVLLLTDFDLPEAFSLMERIRENIECNTTYCEGEEIKITCSIGLAKLLEGETLEASLKKADKALYAAKKTGRNQVKMSEIL